MANARRGYEAHLASEKSRTAAERPRPVARPQLVRVNSVPVLAAPSTPADRIRRSGSGVPHAPSQVDGGAEMLDGKAPAAEPTPPTEKRALDKPTGSRKKKRTKKTTKGQNHEGNCQGEDQQWENWGSEGWAWDGNEADWYGEGEVSGQCPAPAPPATEEAPPSSTTPGQGHACVPHPPAPKTAAKSRPQPTPSSGKGKGGSQAVKVEKAVKVEQDISNSTELAMQDNLRRANTSMQHTPATTEPDLEAMLDKEIDMEPQEYGLSPAPESPVMPTSPHQAPPQQEVTQPGANQPAQVSQTPPAEEESPSTNGVTKSSPGVPRGRKEKTPAQKAAHARYMKFSRSFERIST